MLQRRAAIVTTSYPREPGDPSGHFVEAEALALVAAAWEVHVIAPGPLRGHPRREHGILRWNVGGSRLFRYPGAVARAAQNPFRLFEGVPFLVRAAHCLRALGDLSLVQAHFMVPSAYPIALATRAPIEVVAHGADVRLLAALPPRLAGHAVRKLVRRGAHFRFVAEKLRQTLIDALARDVALCRALRAQSSIAPAAIHVPDVEQRARAARASLGDAAKHGVWVACGRLIASKRIDRALLAAKEHDVLLLVIGSGPERQTLERLAARLRVRARFLGMRPREETLAWIAAADRLVHLSEAEGAPTVIREARALGVPVLATPVGDVPAWAARDPGIQLFSVADATSHTSEATGLRERVHQIG